MNLQSINKVIFYFAIGSAIVIFSSCGMTRKIQRTTSHSPTSPPTSEAPKTPLIPKAPELPFIYGSFQNTGEYKGVGPNWQEVVHWTLKISETEAEFSSACEFSGGVTAHLVATITSKIELDLKENKLAVLEEKSTQVVEGELACPVRTLPGQYQFEKQGELLRLFVPGTSTQYLYTKRE